MLIYSAKLLFQFRRVAQGRARKRVLCEERVVSFKAPHRKAALARAKRLGRAGEHDYDAEGGHLFTGEEGRAMTQRIDRRLDQLPGLSGLELTTGAAQRLIAA